MQPSPPALRSSAMRIVAASTTAAAAAMRCASVARRAVSTTAAAATAAAPLITYSASHAGGDAAAARVGVITLNAPAKFNALTVAMGDALAKTLDAIDYTATNALVITGAGKAFSAGGDFGFLDDRGRDTPSRNAAIMRDFYRRFFGRIRDVPVPVIAAINGPAIGAGLCFAVACDVRIAAASAKLGITFVGLGLHPGMGATYYLPRLVGPQLAAKLCLTGEVISGSEAARIGLVAEAVDDDADGGGAGAVKRAMAVASAMAAQAPVAVRTCVRSLRLQQDAGLEAALWREADAQAQCYAGVDYREGLASVQAKRAASFQQREAYAAALPKAGK